MVVPSRGGAEGVHLRVNTGKETLVVRVGPAWYLEPKEFPLQVGDEVVVTGSRLAAQDRPTLIAVEVRKGGAALRLRDQQGVPAWRGQRAADRETPRRRGG